MNIRVSIAMAVYNGEIYIKEQLDSIISQLSEKDELVISYDKSTDNTWRIINSYAEQDDRIKIVVNKERGVINNFENAVKYCRGKYIFFADQDDVWLDDKIETVIQEFQNPKVTVVIHDSFLTDKDLNIIHSSTFKLRNGSPKLINNLVRLSYIGCCLAFRSELKNIILPIPKITIAHDWWTGSICTVFGKMAMIKKTLIYHRMHENNTTPKTRPPIKVQIKIRVLLVINIFKRCIKYNKILIKKILGTPVIKQNI